jgi:wyosine [tRNA(Phe)-imidazoG37] synthetase (radical SAM superfamily)
MPKSTRLCPHRRFFSQMFGQVLEFEINPAHICPFACIHCRHGVPCTSTIDREEHMAPADFENTLPRIIAEQPPVNFISLAAKGEPALNTNIASFLRTIKRKTILPVAVASCGTLLWRKDVQQDLMPADVVVASLDAGDKATFHYVNRPHQLIPYLRFVQGLYDFGRSFQGQLWLHIRLLDGITSAPSQVGKIAALVARVNPQKIFLATALTGGSLPHSFTIEHERLVGMAKVIGPKTVIIEHEEVDQQSHIPIHSMAAIRAKVAFST